MIIGYAQNGHEEEAIELFLDMEVRGIFPSYRTFWAAIDASSVMSDGVNGRYLHAKSLKFGLLVDVYIGTALVDMYSKCLIMDDAEQAFFEMCKEDVVPYNALVTGYGLIGDHGKAVGTYMSLRFQGIKPDYFTFIGLFTSVATAGGVVEGMQVHSLSINLGINRCDLVGNSIVNFYSKCGLVDCALRAFETLQGSDVLSSAAIISGLVQNNECMKALEVFCEMHKLPRKVDEFSSSSVIKAVASMASVAQGRHLHGYMINVGLVHLIFVGSALIDMYSKRGVIRDAHRLFCETPEKNAVSWNSMITGYAQNGFSNESLILFCEMERCRVSPDSVTFVGILLASHTGLVREGKRYYQLMRSHYGIASSVEHDTYMVNLLGRAGYVDEAEEFLLT